MRVGDVVTVEVLKNDYHPDNDVISLVPEFVETNIGDGVAFTDGDRIRFQAGDAPGTAYVTYEITDSQGQKDAGYLTIQIREAATSRPPVRVGVRPHWTSGATRWARISSRPTLATMKTASQRYWPHSRRKRSGSRVI